MKSYFLIDKSSGGKCDILIKHAKVNQNIIFTART